METLADEFDGAVLLLTPDVCSVRGGRTLAQPVSQESYSRDPRHIARKAEANLRATDIADVSYSGPGTRGQIQPVEAFNSTSSVNNSEGFFQL